MNALCCECSLVPPPLLGPEPLSTASEKQVSKLGDWLSFATAGMEAPTIATAVKAAAIAAVWGLTIIVKSPPRCETKPQLMPTRCALAFCLRSGRKLSRNQRKGDL